MNLRTTPDQQLPANNGLSNRDLWHWCLVWKWEQQSYDVPLLSKLTARQKKDLKTIEQRLTEFLDVKKAPQGQINAARKTFERAAIAPSAAGTGFTGTPVVAPDEQDKKKGEMSWNDIETMLAGFAYDAFYNQNETSKKNYFTVFDYAMDQGFAFGSSMGRTIITAIRCVKYILPPGSCGTRFINILTGMPICPLYVSGLLYRRPVNRVRRSGMNYWIHGIRS